MKPEPARVQTVVEREFDALAPGYETNRLAPWYKAHARMMLDECAAPANGDILDVGCGTGYFLRAYLAGHSTARGLGVDISPAMIEQAGRLADRDGIRNVRFMQADWESLDPRQLDGWPFGLVFCANAFHYFSDPRRAACKLHDALVEGGTLYLLDRNKSNSPLTLLWGWLHRHCIKDNVEFYSLPKLKWFFENAGFGEVKVSRTINRLFWKNKLYTSIALLKCTRK